MAGGATGMRGNHGGMIAAVRSIMARCATTINGINGVMMDRSHRIRYSTVAIGTGAGEAVTAHCGTIVRRTGLSRIVTSARAYVTEIAITGVNLAHHNFGVGTMAVSTVPRPAKISTRMSTMIGVILVPMAGQTGSRVNIGGDNISHRLRRIGRIAGQTRSIMAGAAITKMFNEYFIPSVEVVTGIMVTDRTGSAGRLTKVSRLNGHSVDITVIVGSKITGMTFSALRAGSVADGMTNQTTIDSVMTTRTTQRCMYFTGCNKRGGGCGMTPLAVGYGRCRRAIHLDQGDMTYINVSNRMVHEVSIMATVTVPAAGRHEGSLTIRCLQGTCGFAMTGVTIVMHHGINLVNRHTS